MPSSISGMRLSNGLQIWYDPRPGTGTVALALIMPVGARHDPPRLRGLTHMLEHMLFNGTHRWSENRLRDEVEQRGGDLNGTTGSERTHYVIQLPAAELAFGFQVLQQLVFKPSFPPDLLEREKCIIANEAAPEMSERNWRWLSRLASLGFNSIGLVDRSRQVLFGGTGLEFPPIGFPETRKRITLDDIRAHYQKWYTPGRARLVVVGDFNLDQLRQYAERYLGTLPPGATERPPGKPPILARTGKRWRIWFKFPAKELYQAVALPFGGAADSEAPAIDLLARLVNDELMDRLRMQLGLVYSVGYEVPTFTAGGLIWLVIKVSPAHLKRVEQEMAAILDRLCAGEIEPARLERVRAATLGRLAIHTQSNAQQLEALVNQPGILLGRAPESLAAQLAGVTLEDLRRVAARLLRAENRYRFVQEPSLPGLAAFYLADGLVFAGVVFLIVLIGQWVGQWAKLLWVR